MTRTFHDAVITSVARQDRDLLFALENVTVERKGQRLMEKGILCITQVSRTLANGAEVDLANIGYDDGQILQCSLEAQHARLLIEWEDYRAGTTKTAEYSIFGAAVSWSPSTE